MSFQTLRAILIALFLIVAAMDIALFLHFVAIGSVVFALCYGLLTLVNLGLAAFWYRFTPEG